MAESVVGEVTRKLNSMNDSFLKMIEDLEGIQAAIPALYDAYSRDFRVKSVFDRGTAALFFLLVESLEATDGLLRRIESEPPNASV